MCDWANSAYSTLAITIIAIYLSKVVFPEAHWGRLSGAVYPLALSAATLLGAILSPIVGAMADAAASKRFWLTLFTISGSLSAIAMGLCPPDLWPVVLPGFILTAISFELAYGLYNAFLPELADASTMNRISAFGFACGYIGGGLALLLAMLVLTFGDGWGIGKVWQLRAGFLILGLWWGGFSIPAMIWLRDRGPPRAAHMGIAIAARQAWQEIRGTLRNIRHYRWLVLFLLGYLFYNDCVQTVITQASLFAEKDLGFLPADLLKLVLMIQFVALCGSLPLGWLADRYGAKPALMLCLAVWATLIMAAWFVTTQAHFWLLGVGVGLVLGGTQAVSRGIMATLTPREKSAEFFGFFNLSSKATSFLGPLIFGGVFLLTGEYRAAIASLLLLLFVGWWLVSRVNLEQGRLDALAPRD
jgi:UMF1 family MFS transporter